MTFLPVCLNITGKRIVIIGGGRAAEHKLAALVKYTTNITVVAPQVSPCIRAMPVAIREEAYHEAVLEDAFLVYACTDDAALNSQICHAAHRHGVLVNSAGAVAASDFTSPAIFQRGVMSVAVSSNATDAGRAIRWRERIKEFLGDDSIADR
jgi:precorrin-2 dehydrogenase/sirohydrochlorin ferrochelatase